MNSLKRLNRSGRPGALFVADADEGAVPKGEQTITGTLQRVTFHNEDNGYTVGRLAIEGRAEPITIVGNFGNPVVGEMLQCWGVWMAHAQWGRQFQVQRFEPVRPVTVEAIERYLSSGMVKGVGPVTARRIVKQFGDASLDIIENEPDKLLDVPGIGSKTVETITGAWSDQRDVRNLMLFLQQHGVSPAFAARIYKTYRSDAIRVVEADPFRLAYDVWGIGFRSADKIASTMGIAEDDPRRVDAAVLFTLNEAVETGGSVFLTIDELAAEAEALVGTASIDASIERLAKGGRVVLEDATVGAHSATAVYPPLLLQKERAVAQHILALTTAAPATAQMSRNEESEREWADLTQEQRSAVHAAITTRLLIITGGPGVGKTYTTNVILMELRSRKKRILLASPTGRAAKRLSEVTGSDAMTLHRLLRYDPSTKAFGQNATDPLECDVLLVDEASMLDINLTHAVLEAVPPNGSLILVGDVDQLPSVGPGNVLADIIDSGAGRVVRLTQVFRQAAQSAIIANAHKVNAGKMPVLHTANDGQDFVFVNAEEAEETAAKVVAVVVKSLPNRGFLANDIQVLTPMQKGPAGAANLNVLLQERLNPPGEDKPQLERLSRILRLGDRVIQTRNNYDKGVFNGDVGVIAEVDTKALSVRVRFLEDEATYEQADLDELGLAYALSVHKSQGSEFSAVVLALHTTHYRLLQRNLLYTAITRARRMAVVVGNKKAMALAVGGRNSVKRNTRLRERIVGGVEA